MMFAIRVLKIKKQLIIEWDKLLIFAAQKENLSLKKSAKGRM